MSRCASLRSARNQAQNPHREDKKTKELVALALGVAAHCDCYIGFHTEALVRLGPTREEVEETLYMGGGPSLMYAADAIAAFEEFQEKTIVAA
jgi:AhpD family alkylhydroperoxidase